MGEIKSALEIALERTKSVEGNREAVEADRYQKEGKVIVSKLLSESDFNLKDSLKGYDKKHLRWVREGMNQVLLANLVLPQDQLGLGKLKNVGEAFYSVINSKQHLSKMFSQLESFFDEYLQEKERLKEALQKQYMPRLRQKEEEMSKKLGQPVHIDINSDPEYHSLLRRGMAQLEERYGSVLSRVKKDIAAMFDSEK